MTSELNVQRKLTKAFIDTMPRSLVLTPRTRSTTIAGGYVYVLGTPKPAQVLRLVEADRGQLEDPIRTQDGLERSNAYMLLGEWDADIEVDDIFTFEGDDFTVIQMYYDNGWEIRAKVTRHGD
jgi:hypothetical protein